MNIQVNFNNGSQRTWSENVVEARLELLVRIYDRKTPSTFVGKICEIFKVALLKIQFWFIFGSENNAVVIVRQLKPIRFHNPRLTDLYNRCHRMPFFVNAPVVQYQHASYVQAPVVPQQRSNWNIFAPLFGNQTAPRPQGINARASTEPVQQPQQNGRVFQAATDTINDMRQRQNARAVVNQPTIAPQQNAAPATLNQPRQNARAVPATAFHAPQPMAQPQPQANPNMRRPGR